MNVLGIILSRAGSRGLPDKCVRNLRGRPVIGYTFEHVAASRRLTDCVLTTDSTPAGDLARIAGITVIDRPAELAIDTATVDAAARHAVLSWEARRATKADVVVLLYGNVPVRAEGLIDRAIEHLMRSGADSVRSVAPVSKQHPDWVHTLDGDVMSQFRVNSIYRRQDLDPVYYHDGAVAVVTRDALFGALRTLDDHQSFLGRDRRALVQRTDQAVDIDEPIDLLIAEALLGAQRGQQERSTESPDEPAAVTIAHTQVGPGNRTFVIAEAGVNHDGSTEAALKMVDVAADAGADAVKFQMFRAEDLVTASCPAADYQTRNDGSVSQRSMLARLELTPEEFATIRARCKERSILFLATPFGPQQVRDLANCDVGAIKVASTDLTHTPLLDVIIETGLPIILSTGASTDQDIQRTVYHIGCRGAKSRLILLHCVSCYPTPLDAINLAAIARLHRTHQVPCGLSDHTESTSVGGWAVAVGACVVEKHFTLDRGKSGPDHAMSLDPEQLSSYIAQIREVERAMGDGQPGIATCEREVMTVATRSVVATKDIPAGVTLSNDLLTLKRPGSGITAAEMPDLIGRQTATDIPADTIVSWDMVK